MFRITIIILFGIILSGCSNVKSYSSNSGNNLMVYVESDPDTELSLDIYTVNKKCKTNYEGRVLLEKDKNVIGLLEHGRNYLVFNFKTSSFWMNSTSVTRQDFLLKTKKNYFYEAKASYIDNIYNIEIREKRTQKSSGRELESKNITNCL